MNISWKKTVKCVQKRVKRADSFSPLGGIVRSKRIQKFLEN